MTCPHDINERETAVTADGYCPLCMAAEIERLTVGLQVIAGWADDKTLKDARSKFRTLRQLARATILNNSQTKIGAIDQQSMPTKED